MIAFPLSKEQDTIKNSQTKAKIPVEGKASAPAAVSRVQPVDSAYADTTAVCQRSSIADVTYYDQANPAFKVRIEGGNSSLLFFAENARIRSNERREALVKSLRNGEERSRASLQSDWSVLILLACLLLFTLVRTGSGKLKRSEKILQLNTKNDAVVHDTGGLFHWQSVVLNLISFFVLSLFCYKAADVNGMIPQSIKGLGFWGMCLGGLALAFTIRHAICLATGRMSGQTEAFNEYLAGIYQSYHIAAIILYVLVLLVSYTFLLPSQVFLIAGIATVGLMYLYRVIRLVIIFLKRNISIFYLILYLCALEILPVAVAIRYFTGLD